MIRHNGRMAVLVLSAIVGAACGPSGEERTQGERVAPAGQAAGGLVALAELTPTQGSTVTGRVTFEAMDSHVGIVADVTGLTPGQHGFHIHEIGDCSAPDATSAGGHFNPGNTPHGGPEAMGHHAGDLGNLEADQMGTVHLEMTVDFITLSEGLRSVVGRAVIVHAGEDDLESQPTGNAGARVACGVIEASQ